MTVVDAITGATSLTRFPEAAKQVAVADLLIMSKIDLIDSHSDRTAYASLRTRIRAINPRAEIREATHGVVDTDELFGPPAGVADSAMASLSERAGRPTHTAPKAIANRMRTMEPISTSTICKKQGSRAS